MFCVGDAKVAENQTDPTIPHGVRQSGRPHTNTKLEKRPSRAIRSASSFIGAVAVGLIVNLNGALADKTDQVTTLGETMPSAITVSSLEPVSWLR